MTSGSPPKARLLSLSAPSPLGSLSRGAGLVRALPSLVVSWATPDRVTEQVADAVGTRSELRYARDVETVCTVLSKAADPCLIVVVPADSNAPWWNELRRVRREFPLVPVVALALAGSSSLQAAWRLGRTEVSELVMMASTLDAEDLRIALVRVHADGVVSRLWARAGLRLPDPLVTVVRRALRLAHAPFTAADLASITQLHERSLRKYCERHGLPSPQQLVGWTRLLLAAYYLDERGRAVTEVAELLGFPTPDALRKLIVRYTGHSSTVLRRVGALDDIARRLETAVHGKIPSADLQLVRGGARRPGTR